MRRPWLAAIRSGLGALAASIRGAAAQPGLLRFLFARMLYTDGLTTLFAFGGIYAAGTFGMDARGVLLLGIGLNVTAGLGALGFAFLEDVIGAKPTILVALSALTLLGSAILLVHGIAVFWVLALALGPVRRSGAGGKPQPDGAHRPGRSRAMRISDCTHLSGRVTGFIGPAAIGRGNRPDRQSACRHGGDRFAAGRWCAAGGDAGARAGVSRSRS